MKPSIGSAVYRSISNDSPWVDVSIASTPITEMFRISRDKSVSPADSIAGLSNTIDAIAISLTVFRSPDIFEAPVVGMLPSPRVEGRCNITFAALGRLAGELITSRFSAVAATPAIVLVSALIAGCGPDSTVGSDEPQFITSAECGRCHPAQLSDWQGSHHDLAMQEATEDTVLGDFEAVAFDKKGETTQFLRRGGDFFIRAAGSDGETAEFPVRYTFGVEPLQQYLIELPSAGLQAFTVAWDTRPATQGGQRWFSLHPDEAIPPDDVLHWTGPANNWNAMCAHCHSTNLRKNYDSSTGTYRTRWSELDVACEACHGPGSQHAAWAVAGADAQQANGLELKFRGDPAAWVMRPETGIAERQPARVSNAELETCASCHSRRSLLDEDLGAGNYHDRHFLSTLDAGLYFPDGQIRDEVYVYGSFLQSKMHAAGVTCSDCHNPHSLELKGTTESVCAKCHLPERFAVPSHHRHVPNSAGASCVACHMPSRNYMQIDGRRDHSFRVPRPDLSEKIGTPDACTSCHSDRTPDWASRTLQGWGMASRASEAHFGLNFSSAQNGSADVSTELLGLIEDPNQPAIIRATALTLLAPTHPEKLLAAVEQARADPDPLVRREAARAVEHFPAQYRGALVGSLLRDPARSVRLEAARVLAPPIEVEPPLRGARDRSLEEYREVQRVNADLPGSHLNLAILAAGEGNLSLAEAEYRRALAIGDYFVPAYVNLADLYRAMGREKQAEQLLREASARLPGSAVPLHALGLLLVRQERATEALGALESAAALAPENARFGYVHAVALHSNGKTERALEVLEELLERWPGDRTVLEALVAFNRDAGHLEAARAYAAELQALQ